MVRDAECVSASRDADRLTAPSLDDGVTAVEVRVSASADASYTDPVIRVSSSVVCVNAMN